MAKPALKEPAAKKEKRKKDTPEANSVQELQQAFEKQQIKYQELLRENERMSAEIERLRTQNKELVEQEERRKELDRLAQRRRRTKQRLPKDSQHKTSESENTTQTNMERVKELIEQGHLTNREMANELQIPVGTVADYAAQLVNRGEVPPRKPGRKPKTG